MDWSHGLESGIGVFLDWSFGNKTLEYSVDIKFNSMRDTIYLCANGGHFKTCNKCINFY